MEVKMKNSDLTLKPEIIQPKSYPRFYAHSEEQLAKLWSDWEKEQSSTNNK